MLGPQRAGEAAPRHLKGAQQQDSTGDQLGEPGQLGNHVDVRHDDELTGVYEAIRVDSGLLERLEEALIEAQGCLEPSVHPSKPSQRPRPVQFEVGMI